MHVKQDIKVLLLLDEWSVCVGVKFPASEEMNDELYITIMTITNTVSLGLTLVKICMDLDCFFPTCFYYVSQAVL